MMVILMMVYVQGFHREIVGVVIGLHRVGGT